MTAPQPNWTYRATLVRVVDGDTIVVTVDLGFRASITTPVRLAGVNCPEHGTTAGDAATRYTTRWLAGADLTIVSDKPDRYGDKYGRWLAVVHRADGHVLADDLVTAGHAARWDGEGAKPLPS